MAPGNFHGLIAIPMLDNSVILKKMGKGFCTADPVQF